MGPGPRLRQPSGDDLDGCDGRVRRPPGRGASRTAGCRSRRPRAPGPVRRTSVARRRPTRCRPRTSRPTPTAPPVSRPTARGRSATSPRSTRRGSASSGAAGWSRPRPVSSSRCAPPARAAPCASSTPRPCGRWRRRTCPTCPRTRPATGSPSTSTTPNGPWSAPATVRCSPCGPSHEGEPDLGTDATWDLKPYVAYGDCLVSVAPDWSGRIWWASHDGLVGTLDPTTGQVGVVDLGEEVRHDVAVDAGAAYVVTDAAVHRLVVGGDGTPQVAWRSEYDGVSGSAPVLVDRGTVAITDEVEDRLGVRFLARDDGRTVCRQSVFDKGEGATRSTLADLGARCRGGQRRRLRVLTPRAARLHRRRGRGAGRPRGRRVPGDLDQRGRVACLGRRRQPPQRSALRVGQAPVADRRQRVVPHRDRRGLRPPHAGACAPAPGCSPAAADRRSCSAATARPTSARGPGWSGCTTAASGLGWPSGRPGEPDRLLAALPQPSLRHLVVGEPRGADDPRRTGRLAGTARSDVGRPRQVGGGRHQGRPGAGLGGLRDQLDRARRGRPRAGRGWCRAGR